MKKLILFALVVLSIQARSQAVITSFTGQRIGDSLQFNWNTASENDMFYYEVMEAISLQGYEKVMVHVNVANTTQTTGVNYQASIPLTRATQLWILPLFVLAIAVGWKKTVRGLLLISFIALISCKKETSAPYVVPGLPGISTATQGVFRLKMVDQEGNVLNTGYIVVKY
jgi:hypothetical protein